MSSKCGGKPFNIDHVAIGPSGIFAIETKTWSKFRESKKKENQLTVKGDKVSFPESERHEFPLKQAKGAAATLAEWLAQQTGKKSWVNAQVVTPGWTTAYLGFQNTQICETNCLCSFLSKKQPHLSAARRDELATAIEKKCRALCFEDSNNFLSVYSHHKHPGNASLKDSNKSNVRVEKPIFQP